MLYLLTPKQKALFNQYKSECDTTPGVNYTNFFSAKDSNILFDIFELLDVHADKSVIRTDLRDALLIAGTCGDEHAVKSVIHTLDGSLSDETRIHLDDFERLVTNDTESTTLNGNIITADSQNKATEDQEQEQEDDDDDDYDTNSIDSESSEDGPLQLVRL